MRSLLRTASRRTLLNLLVLSAWMPISVAVWAAGPSDGVVVIAHPGLQKLDVATLRRIWTGRSIEFGGVQVVPLNLHSGQAPRDRFMAAVMGQDDEKFIAYWTVRRYVGKGTPPREVGSPAEMLNTVQNTPGAIGYLDGADLKPGINVSILRP